MSQEYNPTAARIAAGLFDRQNPGRRIALGNLDSYVDAFYTRIVEEERERGWHASEMNKLCMRFEVLRRKHPDYIDKPRKFPGSLLKTFHHGRSLEHLVRNQIFGPLGWLLAIWRCSHCGGTVGSEDNLVYQPAALCPNKFTVTTPSGATWEWSCAEAHAEWELVETRIRIETLGKEPFLGSIDGHIPEGLILGAPGGVGIAELKSKASELFTRLVRPDQDHFIQTQGYIHSKRLRWGLIVYICKGVPDLAMKAYLITADQKAAVGIPTTIRNVEELIEQNQPDLIPRHRDCARATQARPTRCPAAAFCFPKTGSTTK